MALIRCYGKTSDDLSSQVAPTLFNLYFDVAIHLLLEMASRRADIRVANLHGAKFVGNHRKLQHEAIISDLKCTDDMALVADSWDDLKSMLDDMSICS